MSYLPEKKRNLTEKQEAFLNHLVETGGDFKKSAELAGYSGNHYQILKALKNEVVDLASDVLAREAPTAAFKLIEVMKSDKPVPQANNKLQAAQTILDRAGVVKTDKVDINHNVSGGIFILPEKHTIDIEAEDAEYSPLDQLMKLWITEHVNEDGAAIGPYIKAHTVAEANRIAIQYGLLVLGEIQELEHDDQTKKRIVHQD